MEVNTKTNNRLWQARQRLGLEQKQLAYLLGHKSVNQVSRYERGEKVPNLRTALKLELIFRMPISDLFPEHHQYYRAEIAGRLAQINLPENCDANNFEQSKDTHICTYANSLLQKKPTEDEINLAKTHSINLVRKLSDVIYKQ